MPDPEPGLADLFASCAEPIPCPPPPPRTNLRITIAVPDTAWESGTEVTLEATAGIIDRPGGGECWILEGFASAPDGQRSEEPNPWIARPPDGCVPAPEPAPWLALGLGLMLLAGLTRRKRCRSRSRSA